MERKNNNCLSFFRRSKSSCLLTLLVLVPVLALGLSATSCGKKTKVELIRRSTEKAGEGDVEKIASKLASRFNDLFFEHFSKLRDAKSEVEKKKLDEELSKRIKRLFVKTFERVFGVTPSKEFDAKFKLLLTSAKGHSFSKSKVLDSLRFLVSKVPLMLKRLRQFQEQFYLRLLNNSFFSLLPDSEKRSFRFRFDIFFNHVYSFGDVVDIAKTLLNLKDLSPKSLKPIRDFNRRFKRREKDLYLYFGIEPR